MVVGEKVPVAVVKNRGQKGEEKVKESQGKVRKSQESRKARASLAARSQAKAQRKAKNQAAATAAANQGF